MLRVHRKEAGSSQGELGLSAQPRRAGVMWHFSCTGCRNCCAGATGGGKVGTGEVASARDFSPASSSTSAEQPDRQCRVLMQREPAVHVDFIDVDFQIETTCDVMLCATCSELFVAHYVPDILLALVPSRQQTAAVSRAQSSSAVWEAARKAREAARCVVAWCSTACMCACPCPHMHSHLATRFSLPIVCVLMS